MLSPEEGQNNNTKTAKTLNDIHVQGEKQPKSEAADTIQFRIFSLKLY
jgi:hypothetical protein